VPWNRFKSPRRMIFVNNDENKNPRNCFYGDRSKKSFLRYTLTIRTQRIVNYLKKYIEEKEIKGRIRILDIGCADGLMTEDIFRNIPCEIVIGIEKNVSFHLESKRNILYLFGDGCFLPFQSDQFNVIVISAILKHIKNTNAFANELSRVLKMKGIVIITDPRPLFIRMGIIIGKFDKKWLFNIWSSRDYDNFFGCYGFKLIYFQNYMLPFQLGKRCEELLGSIPLKPFFLHQIGVLEKEKEFL